MTAQTPTNDTQGPQNATQPCAVCGTPLPPQTGPGRPRKVCPDDTSPTPGGCARWRDIEQRMHRRRVHRDDKLTTTDRRIIQELRDHSGHGIIIE